MSDLSARLLHVRSVVGRNRDGRARPVLRIAVVVVSTLILMLGGLWLFRENHTNRVLGAKCRHDKNCGSGECVYEHELDDTSGPHVTDESTFASSRGVCTKTCLGDSECPATMTCRNTLIHDLRADHIGVRHCAPRAWYPTESAAR